jgi:CPA2 family monovalent cation:H+ antiporter-2
MGSSFLFQAFVYLAAAVVTVPIARRLGLGSVLGYLLAGAAIGPYALGLVGGGEDAGVMHVAEFGVVMMLFLIGLELKPALLWRLRVPILGMGSAQVLLTTAAVLVVGVVAGLPWRPALALGLVFSMSSTAIVLQSLQERGWLKLRGGQASFSVLLFQDLAVIPILALLPLLAMRRDPGAIHARAGFIDALPAWQQGLAVLAAGALVLLAGRFLVRPLFRFIAAARTPEVFTAAALLLVIGIALLMQTVGLSPALGAFLAGVVLAESEYRHELEGDIAPFKGLLLGLFFLSVGASIDFPFIAARLKWIVEATAAIVLLKFAVLLLVGMVFRRSWRDSLLFGVALSQVGEFAFVLLALADSLNVLSPLWTRGAVAVTALSMVVTPPLLMLLARAARRHPRDQAAEREMDTIEPEVPGKVILAGFGRMGNVIGRFLQANGVPTTVLDLDAELVDGVRKVGLKAWYGDASRLDMLRAAGAEQAEVLILTLADTDRIKAIGELARKHFPHLKILARSKRRVDAYELINAGFEHVYRETLGTSLEMGADALRMLGFRAYHARRAALAFRKHNESALRDLAGHWGGQHYFAMLRAKIEEAESLVRDGSTLRERVDAAWDNESLRDEAAKGTLRR